MLRKLIENWLDSASERTYQPVFCQMLIDQGYTVIHSTRHHPLEFGKDVIAKAPDGTIHAFQLKGNPKSRITLSQYRKIHPQLRELVHQTITNPSLPKSNHKSFLVTNGEIDEDVQIAIDNENSANERDGYPHRKLEIISRGQLLVWANKLNIRLWPSELEDTKTFLEIITEDGDGPFPTEKLDTLLKELLLLNNEEKKPTKAKLNRHIKSASLLIALSLKPYSEKNNHWAIINAWTLFSAYLTATAAKNAITLDINNQLLFVEEIIFEHTKLLMIETLERPNCLGEGEALSDFAVYPWRQSLLIAIGSIFWLWCNKDDIWPEGDFRTKLEEFLFDGEREIKLWGEAAFPQALFHLWAREEKECKCYTGRLVTLTTTAINTPMPCVYHDAETVINHCLSEDLEAFQSSIQNELMDTVSTSWFARQLLLHMAFRGEKTACQDIWPQFSKISSACFLPESDWEYCLYRSDNGNNMTYVPKIEEQWIDLLACANESAEQIVPKLLLDRAWLLSFWILFCPQRGLHQTINHLFSEFRIDTTSA